MQASLLPVVIEHEFDATFEGKDLKRLGSGQEGHIHAVKGLADHPSSPIWEWVGHHLCRATGIRIPDFNVMRSSGGQTHVFDSRNFDAKRQMYRDPGIYEKTVQAF